MYLNYIIDWILEMISFYYGFLVVVAKVLGDL